MLASRPLPPPICVTKQFYALAPPSLYHVCNIVKLKVQICFTVPPTTNKLF